MRSSDKSRRIRVLHVIDSLDLGGAQAVLINLIRHGDQSRFDFEAATMYGQGVYWDKLRDLGVPVHSLSFDPRVPLYVPRLSGDAAAFTSRVCELIEQPSVAARLAEAALQEVRAGYSAESMARAVESIYSKYLCGGAGA